MTAVLAPQPIAGVSTSQEGPIDIVYASIAATALGRLIGAIMDCIPVRIWGVKVSNLLFGLPLAPLGLTCYLLRNIFGQHYELTNRSVAILSAGGVRQRQVALKDIASVEVDVRPGQEFHHAADLVLLNAKGDEILRLAGTPRPERFRRNILEARDARLQSDESLARINKRS